MSKNKKIRSDLKNGGILLEELITSFDGKTNSILCFSSDQILKATDNFSESRVISGWFYFNWYKGVIEDRTVSIKKWSSQYPSSLTKACRDISVSSQMSGHTNSLKLIGCCLEFDSPVLVCEYTEHGPLNRDGAISSGEVLPWKVRLKIAKEIASVITYLHKAFPETIIHRYIIPTNIFIDSNWTAKLSGFGFSVAIPDGEIYVEDCVRGVVGFLDPDYHSTAKVTEKVDIYSFGVMMLVLLSGRAAVLNGADETRPRWLKEHVCEVMEKGGFEEIAVLNGADETRPKWLKERVCEVMEKSGFYEIVDKEIWNAPCDDLVRIRSQVQAFLTLALRCVRYKTDEPVSSMIEVAKELKLIEKLS